MFKVAMVAVAALSVAGPALADGSLTSRIELRGYVPVICRAQLQSAPSVGEGGLIQLGALDEFCNAGSGYRVVVDYMPSENPGEILVDGRPIQLSSSGRTVIVSSTGPAMVTRNLAYMPGAQTVASLNIHVETAMA